MIRHQVSLFNAALFRLSELMEHLSQMPPQLPVERPASASCYAATTPASAAWVMLLRLLYLHLISIYGKKELYYDRPAVLVEIGSPGTQYLDRVKKKQDYRQLPSLLLYLMIDSTRNQLTGIYRKSGNTWEEFGFSGEIALRLPPITGLPERVFTAAEVYEKTVLRTR
jgi:hypothetical protein